MQDRKSTKKPLDHVKKHLKICFNSDPDLMDEAYVQVLKQIHEHPNIERARRGWDFFAILASTFAPSEELLYSILNHLLFEIKHNKDQNIPKRANYIFLRLIRLFENPRKNIPSELEIMHIEVHFLNLNM